MMQLDRLIGKGGPVNG